MTDYLKCLYLGDAGSGKTTALMGALNYTPHVTAWDLEHGIKTRPLTRAGVNIPAGWTPTTIRDTKTLDKAVVAAMNEADRGEGSAVYLFDTASEYQSLVIMELGVNRVKTGQGGSAFKTELKEWGEWTGRARYLWRQLRDLQAHVAISAQEIKDTDEDGSVAFISDLTPKAAVALRAMPDVVVHMRTDTVGDTDYVYGYAKTNKLFRGKDRVNVFPRHGLLVNPSMDKLLRHFNDEADPELDAETAAYIKAKKAA